MTTLVPSQTTAPMPIQWVRYYYLPPGSVVDRNTGIAVVFGNWPQRALKSRSWLPSRLVTERVASIEEHEWLRGCYRHMAILYSDVEALFRDEAEFVEPKHLAIIANAMRSAGVP